jgi:Tfp pilus assembly protein PilO
MNSIRRIWQRLSKREKSLVVVTFMIFGLLLGRSFVLTPFLERRTSIENQLETQPQRLERNLRYIDRKAEIMGGLEKSRAELKSHEPLLLTGDTASVSASDLQQTVQAFASTRGGAQIVSTRVLNVEAMGAFTRIPIQLEISGVIEQVAGLIQGIESAPKLLVINEINVRSFAVGGALPRRPDGAAPAPVQNLRVSLTVSGYIRSQPAVPSKETSAGPGKKAPPSKDLEETLRRRRGED